MADIRSTTFSGANEAATPIPTSWREDGRQPASNRQSIATQPFAEEDLLDDADVELFGPGTVVEDFVVDVQPPMTVHDDVLVVDNDAFDGVEAVPVDMETRLDDCIIDAEDMIAASLNTSNGADDAETPELTACQKFSQGCGVAVLYFFLFLAGIIVLVMVVGHYALDAASYILICCAHVFVPEETTRSFQNGAARQAYNEQERGSDQCSYCILKTISVALQAGGTAAAGVAVCFYAIITPFFAQVFEVDFRPDYEPVPCCVEAEHVERHYSIR